MEPKDIEKYANMSFASLKRAMVQDLVNNRNESAIYKKYPKERVVKMLENPQQNEKDIREMSGFLYLVSSHYRRLVDYCSYILKMNYTIIPTKLPSKIVKKKYKDTYHYIATEAEKYNLKHEAKKALKIAVRDGVYFGLYYENEDSFYIKPFDNRYAEISTIEDGCFNFAIDLEYFTSKLDILPAYGKEIELEYYRYKGNTKTKTKGNSRLRWFEPSNCICIKADESDPVYSLPLFTGLILDVFDIEDYKLLHKAKTENDNYHALAMKLETDDDGVPKMEFETSSQYYNQACANLPEGIGLIMSPFDIKDFKFQSSSTAEKNDITQAEENFWFSAGVSSLIFGSTKATSSASLTLSVKPDEEVAYSLLEQFAKHFNKKIKKMDLEYEFKIDFLDQSIFNSGEVQNALSKAAQYGVGGSKLKYAASLDMTPSDIIGLSYLEDEILGLTVSKWKNPLVSSNTQSTVEKSNGGRPTSEEGDSATISESNEQTRENDSNSNK